MKISARNQFEGTISSVVEGAVNGVVTITFEGYAIKADITMESIKGLELADGNKVTGSITNEAIESLGLAEGEKAVAIIKSTDVMVGVE